MNQLDDILTSVKSAKASADTAIALIDKVAGPERTLMEGYMGGSAQRAIRSAMRELEKAQTYLVELGTALAHQERIADERRRAREAERLTT